MTDVTITERNGKRMLIPTVADLEAAIAAVPRGEQGDLGAIRRSLAAEYGANQCCPVTTQRLLVQFSERDDVPYWRVVDADKPFARRLRGGADRIRAELAKETGQLL